ncbi:MAG: efflux transporter outer membrane subunit [Burkholderiaceae bacterium]|nr:efflux transporter outer membrane subunit [Burkholderiaceae bacterium]
MKKRWFFPCVALISTVSLSGCALFPAQLPDHEQSLVPATWNQVASPSQEVLLEAPAQWWKRWNNEDLMMLIEATLSNNTDVVVAQSNLRAAQASLFGANASLLPTASIGADASSRRANDVTNESYSADAAASWSFSFGGRDIAARRSAALNASAKAMLLDETKSAMSAEVASSYIRLCLAKQKLTIAQKSLNAYEEAKSLSQWRYQAGLVEATDVEQAVAQYESAKATIASYEQSILQYQTALSRLTLLPLGQIQAMATDSIPQPPEAMSVSIPARVLELRPDVQAAKQMVLAAMEDVRVAQADYLPSLSLSGTIGTTAATIGALGASGTGVGALIASLSMPIINWGSTIAKTEQQKAALDRATAQYRQSIVAALEETENALSAMKTADRRQASLNRATQSSELAAQLALQQYSSGLVDYQTVLSTQRSLFSAQETQATNQADWATAHIDLYRTLGGGWKPQQTTTGE